MIDDDTPLFTHQSPQPLRVLPQHPLIESAGSSNRIEGVEVDDKRVATLVFGSPALRDRDQEDLRGYRAALDLIHLEAFSLQITGNTVQRLHQLTRAQIRSILRKMKSEGRMASTGHRAGARSERIRD
jgi:hypothetical protein